MWVTALFFKLFCCFFLLVEVHESDTGTIYWTLFKPMAERSKSSRDWPHWSRYMQGVLGQYFKHHTNYIQEREFRASKKYKSRRVDPNCRSIKRFGHCQVLSKKVWVEYRKKSLQKISKALGNTLSALILTWWSYYFGRFVIECRMVEVKWRLASLVGVHERDILSTIQTI